jgi:hypothetical protein
MCIQALRGLARYALAALPLLIVVLPHMSFSPLWDGAVYANCIIQSVADGLDLWTLNCSHHPSVASLLPAAVAMKISGGAMWSIHAANLILAICAVWAFLGILDELCPDIPQVERALGATALAAMPVMSASVLHTNTDHGAFVFSVLLLFGLITSRPWIVAISSVALPLTKEIGIGLWFIIVGSYALTAIICQRGSVVEKCKRLLLLWPAMLAPLAVVWYASGRFSRGLSLIKPPRDDATSVFMSEAFSFSPYDPVLQSYLASIFILNFSWVLTAAIVLGVSVYAVRWMFGERSKPWRLRRYLTALIFIAFLVLLTRFKTFSNVRYFLPIFPYLLIAAFLSLHSLVRWELMRLLCLGIIIALFQISAFRTVDPVSKRVYGSFMFGRNPMLDMTSITKECCGRGRDQLVYNIQFTYIDLLTNKVIADQKSSALLPIVIPNHAYFDFLRGVVGTNPPRRVAVTLPDAQPIPVFLEHQLANMPRADLPQQVIWLNLPNVDGADEFQRLQSFFYPVEEKVYDELGYELSATVMSRR